MASSSFNFYSLVTAVKDTSSKALATLSSDLKEFSTTVQEDVSVAAKEVKRQVEETLKERAEARKEEKAREASSETPDHDENTSTSATVKASLFAIGSRLESVGSKFLSSADEFLGGLVGDTPAKAPPVPEELSSGRRFRLLALQEASDTYLDPPADFETFQTWKASLSPEDFQAFQADVLQHYPAVQEKFNALVPSSLDADTFWSHYLYKSSLLAAQEQRSALLLEKVDDEDEDITWDVESPTHAAQVTEPTEDAPAATATAEAVVDNAPRSMRSEEGWVDVEEKKAAETKQEDALDWGDDDEVLDTTTTTAITTATTTTTADDWGQWE
ncbi:BSD domain-containing protein 1 [Aphanomyces cochlioides]|nr:BSD domain-containing protein 1 [Aphanomyces cochlioides]